MHVTHTQQIQHLFHTFLRLPRERETESPLECSEVGGWESPPPLISAATCLVEPV